MRRTSWHGHWFIVGKQLELYFSSRLKPRHHPVKHFTWYSSSRIENVWENVEEGIELHAATAPMKYRFQQKYPILEQEEVEREGSVYTYGKVYQMICDERVESF